jgi:hypothetical protein
MGSVLLDELLDEVLETELRRLLRLELMEDMRLTLSCPISWSGHTTDIGSNSG